MTAAETRGVSVPVSEEQSDLEMHIQRQIGCMTGFLQLFDRNQILAGRRLYSAKRLPFSAIGGSTSPSERSDASVVAGEILPSSPESLVSASEVMPARPSAPLPLFDFKDGTRSSWKLREAPRLSLDSRAIVDGKGKLRPREIRTASPAAATAAEEEPRRSPSVVARLMGLDALPNSGGGGGGGGVENGVKNPELRRSASESRASSNLSRYRFLDPLPPPISSSSNEEISIYSRRNLKQDSKPSTPIVSIHRKSYFEDVFPDPPAAAKRIAGSVYGEIERRLRMRGIHEPAKDLETLKQILEAIQLKGLLHGNRHHNLVHSRDSPIVVMKPAAKPPPARQSPASSPPSPGRGRREMYRNIRPGQRPADPASQPVRGRRQANAEPQRRVLPVNSPRIGAKKAGSDPVAVRSPRNRRPPAEAAPKERRVWSPPEEVTSQLDFEGGRRLLERCDKLLLSIAAMTEAEKHTGGDGKQQQQHHQPSPVSVLDASSFLSDESSPSPPLAKRSIHFRDELAEWEDKEWNEALSVVRSREGIAMDDQDFIYVSEIIRASDRYQDSDIYLMLEKRHQEVANGDDSDASRLQRRLVFDAVAEIIDRKRRVLSWDLFSLSRSAAASGRDSGPAQMLGEVWSEVGRIRVHIPADDLDDMTCGAIMKDMTAGDGNWAKCPSAEMSDAVLNIERQIFKDLVAETIRDLAAAVQIRPALSRRKLYL